MVGNDDKKRFYDIVGKNIRKYREIKNYSLQVLGEKVGVEKKTIQRYEVGEAKFDMYRLSDIADALGISIARLLEGTEAFLSLEPSNPDVVSLPILGLVPAGGPVMVYENIEGYLPLPKVLVKDKGDFCLRVRGDSMEDIGISDGDYILVHPQPVADNGQTVIARIGDEVTCKRYYKLDGKCRLEPANQNYKPISCEHIEIIGIVTRVIKEIY